MKRETASKEVVFFYDYKHFDSAQCDISNTNFFKTVSLSGVEDFFSIDYLFFSIPEFGI